MTKFARLDRLPPYVFATVNEIKMKRSTANDSGAGIAEFMPYSLTPRLVVAVDSCRRHLIAKTVLRNFNAPLGSQHMGDCSPIDIGLQLPNRHCIA